VIGDKVKGQAHRSASWRNFIDEIDLNCPNNTTMKDYDIQVLIGQGAFGTVKRATMKKATRQSGNFHRNVAIKQYDKFKLY